MQIAKKLKDNDEKNNSICKISLYTEAVGFFLRIKKKKEYNFLITCYHVLSESIRDKSDIEIRLKNDKKKVINLDDPKRLIKYVEEKDIAAIEIKNKDNIKNSVNFLNMDLNNSNANEYNQYKNKDIIVLEYYSGTIYYKKGNILDINDKNCEFKHNLLTKEESDGSPIILVENSKVIGIQKRTSYGIFISELLKELD